MTTENHILFKKQRNPQDLPETKIILPGRRQIGTTVLKKDLTLHTLHSVQGPSI